MSVTYGYGTQNNPIRGQAKVTFGNFDLAEKCYVKFRSVADDEYNLALYKEHTYNKPYKEEVFKGSDICGLDWGSFEKQKKVMKYFYKPPKIYTYVTIINKTKSISLLFSSDEGEQLNHWKLSLQELLYRGRTYIREKLKYENQNVLLQAGKGQICLTEERQGAEPARLKNNWDKEMFFDCAVTGRMMTLIFKSSQIPCTDKVLLECERGEYQDGQLLSSEETLTRIRTDLFNFVVCHWFTKESIYEGLQEVMYKDYGSDYYDLNKLEVIRTGGGQDQMRYTMYKVYQKVKKKDHEYAVLNKCLDLTKEEQFIVNAGHIIQKIRADPPRPDTLDLPVELRTEICLKLYTDTQMGRTTDWTALASQIGIKQGSVDTVKGILANERTNEPAAEIILRHWQYTYNKYWHRLQSDCPNRPRLPCTKEGLITALKNIGRNDLVLIVSGEVRHVKGASASENHQYQDIS